MKEQIKDLNGLKNLVMPAINSKYSELQKMNLKYINKDDIWDYLINRVWINNNNLMLNDVVDNIIKLDNQKLEDYVQEKILGKRNDLL